MTDNWQQRKHSYRIELGEDLVGSAKRIEFEATNLLRAMSLTQDAFRERELEFYEDGKALGRLKCDIEGFWTVRRLGSEPDGLDRLISVS